MKRVYRSRQDSKIAGVCGGLGDYFDIDPVFFRLVFLLSVLFGGLGALAYVVMWIMVPAQEGMRRDARRLRLSAADRKIGGVCGGLGELLYVLLWLVIPGPGQPVASGEQPGHP